MKSICIEHLIRAVIAFIVIVVIFSFLHFLSRPDPDNTVRISHPPEPIDHVEAAHDNARTLTGTREQPSNLQQNNSFVPGRNVSVISLLTSWLKFFLVYLINLMLLYYGVQTLGVMRFIISKRPQSSFLHELKTSRTLLLKSGFRKSELLNVFRMIRHPVIKLFKVIFVLALFTPAYVVAYTFKTNFNTESLFFMVALACLTNGFLIMYAEKFYQLLVNEYRKGYVETALANEHSRDFTFHTGGSLTWSSVLSFHKHFSRHALEPVYQNARRQYLSSLREQASFLITCMIIIEMALNIHGHLGYELLQRLLFRDYFAAAALCCGIFFIVKLTELFTDVLLMTEQKRHANR